MLRSVVETLADPANLPAVFFCNAGKDRTGVVAAMVLGLLGVDDETVAADYALTQDVLDQIYAATQRDYPVDVKAWRNLSPDMRYARAETMLEFLELLRGAGWRLGGVRGVVGSADGRGRRRCARHCSKKLWRNQVSPPKRSIRLEFRRLDARGPGELPRPRGLRDGRRPHGAPPSPVPQRRAVPAHRVRRRAGRARSGVTTLIDFRTPHELGVARFRWDGHPRRRARAPADDRHDS